MKVTIFIVSCIVAIALCIDAYFIYLHFFDDNKAKQIISLVDKKLTPN